MSGRADVVDDVLAAVPRRGPVRVLLAGGGDLVRVDGGRVVAPA